jgi:hypothetical protein
MTEEPKQDAGASEVTEQKVARRGPVVGFFRDHPTLVLSLLYLYASGVGMGYSAVLYGSFGINVFDYFEITDFLLAAFKNPLVIAINGMTGAVLVMIVVSVPWRRPGIMVVSAPLRPGRRPRINDTYRRQGRQLWLVIGLISVFFSVSILALGALISASFIKDGETPAVDIWYRSFKGSAGQIKEPNLRLIGATQKAVFFYDLNVKDNKKDNHTLVVPQSQIVSIKVPH